MVRTYLLSETQRDALDRYLAEWEKARKARSQPPVMPDRIRAMRFDAIHELDFEQLHRDLERLEKLSALHFPTGRRGEELPAGFWVEAERKMDLAGGEEYLPEKATRVSGSG